MTLTFPQDTRSIINQMREAIGRDITFVTKLKSDCPTCTLNPVTDTSTDPYCPTCSGLGYLYTISGYTIGAHVTFGKSDFTNWQSGGIFLEGDCRAQVENLEETVDAIDSCDYVIVDGRNFTIRNKIPRGVPEINRYLLDLVEQGESI